ncbi:MAG: VanZ family protein [Anaerolineales bacterium]
MLRSTTSRLAFALLGYMTLVVLLLTLNPFYLAVPQQIRFAVRTTTGDAISNIILFLPIGFLYRLTTQRRNAWLLGAAISASIEITQLFIPARTPSLMDLLNNTMGTALGALIHNVLSSRFALTPNIAGRLRLETPLMGFIYLLIPLLWMNGLAQIESPNRWVLTLLIGICGASVFNDVYRQWLAAKGFRLTVYASLSAAAWFLFGAGTSLLHPFPYLWIGLAVTACTALLTLLPRHFPDRRFERVSLQRLIPIFALYTILLALWSPVRPFTSWHGMIGLTNRIQDTSMQALYSRLEYLVAFSILGYLTAEWRGRAELSVMQDLPGLLAVTGGSALALEILAGFQAGMGASLMRFLLGTGSALAGGTIYHVLRDHVRYLLGHTSKQSKIAS